MNLKRASAVAAVLSVLGAAAAQAATITFDDLDGAYHADFSNPVPNGYAGLDWTNFDVLDGEHFPGDPSGYQNGIVTPDNIVFSGGGNPAAFSRATAFTLDDLYLTAAWNDGLTIAITGRRAGSVIDTYAGTVDASGPTHIVLNWANIDEVDFASSGGVSHGYRASGEQLVMDNVTLDGGGVPGVPEPATWAMLIVGLGVIGLAARRRKPGLARAA